MSSRGPLDARESTRLSSLEGALPAPPVVEIELLRELSRPREGFLGIREVELRNRYEDGATSAPYRYFMVDRERLDAVAIVLFRRSAGGLELVLRSQLRPPLHFRGDYDVPLEARGTGAVQWEIPAGLMEPGERGTEGLFVRASAEAREEVGLDVAPSRFALLGPPVSLSPGLIGEKLHFVAAELRDDDARHAPSGDGHAVEEGSRSLLVSLPRALEAIDQGRVHDIKTELGIRRLAALHAAPAASEAHG